MMKIKRPKVQKCVTKREIKFRLYKNCLKAGGEDDIKSINWFDRNICIQNEQRSYM